MKAVKQIINVIGLIAKYGIIAAAFAKAVKVFHEEIKHLAGEEEPEPKSEENGDK